MTRYRMQRNFCKLLRGLDCRINLIRFHAIPGVNLEGADMETMTAFRDYLTSHGLFYHYTVIAWRGYICRLWHVVHCQAGGE